MNEWEKKLREAVTGPGMYATTGEVLDINRIEVNRGDLRALLEEVENQRCAAEAYRTDVLLHWEPES